MSAENFHLEGFKGKVVLVDFWASWCVPCRQSVPWLRGVQKKYGADGLVVVPVNVDRDTAKAHDMMQQFGPDVVLVADPDGVLAEKYGLEGMPSSFLFDRQGRLVARHVGFLAKEEASREREIVKTLGGKP